MPLIDLKDATIYLRDRATNWVEVRVGEGNLTYSEKRTIEADKDRGNPGRIREGEKELVEVSFEFLWEEIRSATDVPTLEEVLKGMASGWVSAASNPITGDLDPNAPFSVHIQIVRENACGQIEQYLFVEFNYEELAHDMKNASISCKGICNHYQVQAERLSS